MLIALELDGANFYNRAFLDIEVHLYRCRRNCLDFGLDGGELVAVFCEQRLDHRFGALDLGGVILAFNRQSDLLFLESVKDI